MRLEDIPDFPLNNIITKSLPLEGVTLEDLSSQWERDADREYGEWLELEKEDAELDLTFALRSLQLSEWGKKAAEVELARDFEAEGNSVVVFTCFKKSGEWVANRLGCPFISSDMTGDERQEAIEAFQANRIHHLVIMTAAGGEGISLHDLHGRPRASIINLNYNIVQVVQTLGRICRDGALSPANQYFAFASGCEYEDRIRRVIDRRRKELATLTLNN